MGLHRFGGSGIFVRIFLMNLVFSPEGLLSRLVEQGPMPPGQLGWDSFQVLHNRYLLCYRFGEPIRSAHRLDPFSGKNSISRSSLSYVTLLT